ncbi:YktB family protein [Falsibacillus albus]|uniref:UPF0637 protein D9X91_09795 n=1 Tax=Falsibacillus albus TaxID=2478915 RepID=A0A3L7K0H8_9BACI|nr:DUF1054 domain-containing protein [Falsibacillus albus]RLQ95899.1 DUF1054 domain-containing protein [Falsibacillus albus]
MTFNGFTNEDFEVFSIDGLDARMEALKSMVRPKLESLGEHFSPTLSSLCGVEMHYHVAKHARRTKNPPNDTWVSFANNRRGYKMLPHFQIGLWSTHVFVWFAVIYEAPHKAEIGKKFASNVQKIEKKIPNHFVWSKDHTKPDAIPMSGLSEDELLQLFQRLQDVKKAELLCGIHIPKAQAIKMSGKEFIEKVDDAFAHLIPLYKLS